MYESSTESLGMVAVGDYLYVSDGRNLWRVTPASKTAILIELPKAVAVEGERK